MNSEMNNWADNNHGPLLKSLISLNGHCKTIVEIGTFHGSSLKWLCEGARSVGGHVYAFDWFESGDTSPEYIKQMMLDYGFSEDLFTISKVNTSHQEFTDLLQNLCPIIDLAFIDGSHDYDVVKSDFLNIYPLLDPYHGIILFHDTGNFSGPRQLVNELRNELNDETFDIIEFPWAHNGANDGIALLAKRPYPKKSMISVLSGGNLSPEKIYENESNWYLSKCLLNTIKIIQQ